MMISSKQRNNLQEKVIDIETIRREAEAILEKRVKEALERYVKKHHSS